MDQIFSKDSSSTKFKNEDSVLGYSLHFKIYFMILLMHVFHVSLLLSFFKNYSIFIEKYFSRHKVVKELCSFKSAKMGIAVCDINELKHLAFRMQPIFHTMCGHLVDM